MTMSAPARDKLTIVQTEIIADVGIDAVKNARRRGLQTVDEQHVDEAASRLGLGNGSGAVSAVANNVGGILMGAGIASIYAIVFGSGPHTNTEIITAFSLSVLGAILMAVSITLAVMKGR